MAHPRQQRRLSAIMAADIAGYSQAMEADEEGTLARLAELRASVVDVEVAAHGGRIFKEMGDGLLVEFSSSVDALRCAVGIQRLMRSRNETLPAADRLTLRIGVNLGDVLIEGDDIHGNGVNVASRLEGLAVPGGICLSGRVFEDVENTVDTEFIYLGARTVKNIRRPVQVHAVRLFPGDPVPRLPDSRRGELTGRRTSRLVVGCAVLLALIAGAGWVWLDQDEADGEIGAASRLPLPDRPSIAVLPFANLGGEDDQHYFADGITEDLTTDLSKVSGLFVIARNSAFAFRDTELLPGQIAAALGVRYLLQGSVRRAGRQVRINAQLTDALDGETVWAERYDGSFEDIFSLQDAVTRQIVSVLSVQLSPREQAVLARIETDVPDAHDAFLRGWEHYLRQKPEDVRLAIVQFEEAIALDPEYGRAHAAIAASYWQIAQRWWHGSFNFPNAHRARAHAEKLLTRALRWETPLAHQVATAMLSQQGRHTEALAQGAKALALDPNDADSFAALAGALSLAGDADQALTMIDRAMRLNPRAPGFYQYQRGLAEFGLGNFSRAAAALEAAIALNSDDRWSSRLLVATYGHLGQRDAAQPIIERDGESWYGTDPFTVRAVTYWYPYRDTRDRERLAEGLRKAGLPE